MKAETKWSRAHTLLGNVAKDFYAARPRFPQSQAFNLWRRNSVLPLHLVQKRSSAPTRVFGTKFDRLVSSASQKNGSDPLKVARLDRSDKRKFTKVRNAEKDIATTLQTSTSLENARFFKLLLPFPPLRAIFFCVVIIWEPQTPKSFKPALHQLTTCYPGDFGPQY